MHQPTPTDLRKHERIKFELRLAGTSLAEISRELGISQASVSTVSMGKRRSRKIQRAIANRLGRDPEQLWPKRYRKKESRK
ncbi:helix-turn-helix domain-containing protein [Ruegeria hyattellae]|uniref:helix-turn-helix domain-containing protein n=1 Tax=Ruegeria hyattellae TaxID=3233337 RepID=UPI00355BAD9D